VNRQRVVQIMVSERPKRFMRYTGGSIVALTTSEVAFVLCYASGIVGTTAAAAIAFMAGAVPNYVLNRRWVWKRRGRVRVWREVVLYAAISVVSIAAAAAATGWATNIVHGSKAVHTVAAAAAYLVTYGVLFVAKFIAFEAVVFSVGPVRGTPSSRSQLGLRSAAGDHGDPDARPRLSADSQVTRPP
jgi:putative flippase GtrA